MWGSIVLWPRGHFMGEHSRRECCKGGFSVRLNSYLVPRREKKQARSIELPGQTSNDVWCNLHITRFKESARANF